MKKLLVGAGMVMAMIGGLVGGVSPTSAAVPGLPFTQTGCEEHSDSVARLYSAGLGRTTEQGGFEFWLAEYEAGRWSLPSMANHFAGSDEFLGKYGSLDDLQFVQQIYRNVLGREGEAEGVAFWAGQIAEGSSRGTILLRFSESPENITRTGTTQPELGPFNQGLLEPWTCRVTPPNPGDVVNCGDFATQAEAQAWFDTYFAAYGDVAKLDRNDDGVACETLP